MYASTYERLLAEAAESCNGDVLFVAERKKSNDLLGKKYQLDCVIGSGGFGTVYSGTRRSDGLPVSPVI